MASIRIILKINNFFSLSRIAHDQRDFSEIYESIHRFCDHQRPHFTETARGETENSGTGKGMVDLATHSK
jgi:hypothetical protein